MGVTYLNNVILISIDLGTSSVKTGVYDISGNLLAIGKHPIYSQDINEWTDAVEKSVSQALKEYKSSDHVKYITVVSTSGSFILVDEYGNPLIRPSMYYEKDVEAYRVIKDKPFVKVLGDKGIVLDATSPITRLYGIKRNHPEIYSKARWVVPPTTWLLYRICGKEKWVDLKVDYTNALKFGLDITSEAPKYVTEVYEELGLDPSKMPDPVPCGEYICEAKSDLAVKLGFKNALVFQGMTDGVASALAMGALEEGNLSVYSGSTTVIKMVTKNIVRHPSLYYHLHPLGGFLASLTTGFTGAYLSWFSRLFNIDLEELDKILQKTEPGKEYIFFPAGDRAPFYEPEFTASLLGLKIEENIEQALSKFLRGIIVGLGLVEYHLIELLEEVFNADVKVVSISGGGSKSKVFNKIRASIYEREIYVYPDIINAGPLVPILLKTKLYSDTRSVKEKFLRPIDIIQPDPDLSLRYNQLKNKYAIIWTRLRELYSLLHST